MTPGGTRAQGYLSTLRGGEPPAACTIVDRLPMRAGPVLQAVGRRDGESMFWRTLRTLAPWLVAAGVFLWWWPLTGAGLHGGDYPGHLALRRQLLDAIAAGQPLPLWASDGYFGASLVSTYPQAVFSLIALEPFTRMVGPERGLAMGAAFWIAAASAGMYAWLRAWAGSATGALLGALLYGLQAPLVAFVGDEGQMHQPVTLATVPVVFLAWLRLAERPNRIRGAAAAVASTLLLYDMQRFWIVLPFALATYAATAFATTGRSRPAGTTSTILRAGAAAALAGIGIAALAAFPALPMLEERPGLQWHPRHAIDGYRAHYSLASVVQLVDRDGAVGTSLGTAARELLTGRPGHWYLGAASLAALLLACSRAARGRLAAARTRRLAWTSGGLALALALAFGPISLVERSLALLDAAPLARPGTSAGAAAARAWTLGVAALACLCAFALRRALVRHANARRVWTDLGFAVFCTAVALGAPFAWAGSVVPVYDLIRAPAHFAMPLAPFLLSTCAAFAFAGDCATHAHTAAQRTGDVWVAAALAALAFVDLAPYRARLVPEYPARAVEQIASGFAELRDRAPGRVLDVSGYSPISDWAIAEHAGQPAAWGWLSWRSPRHSSEVIRGAVLPGIAAHARSGDEATSAAAVAVAALGHVRYLSEVGRQRRLSADIPGIASVVERPGLRIYEVEDALGFVQLYGESTSLDVPAPGALLRMARTARRGVASLTPFQRADRPSSASANELPRLHPGRPPGELAAPCDTERRTPTRVDLTCSLRRPGLLVVAQSWSPRWRVHVDDEPRELLRANHAFQGVEIRAGDLGERRVVFEYEASPLLRASLATSALAWCSVLGMGVAWLARRAREPRESAKG